MNGKTKPIRVLLVKDSAALLWGLGRLISGEAPRMAAIGSARNADEALIYARLRPHVIVLDLELGGAGSADLIPLLRERSGGRVLIHTGIGDRRLHEDALLFGAAGIVASDAPAGRVLEAIAAVGAGRYWNADPALISAPRSDDAIAAGAAPGVGFLSAIERNVIVRLADGARGTPPTLEDLVAIYSKLGLRNRRELELFARRFGDDLA